MRVPLVSDAHGNAVGLRAALEDIGRRGADVVVALGDMAQGGPEPAACLELLRAIGARVVLGNSDAFLLDADAGAEVPTERQLVQRSGVGRVPPRAVRPRRARPRHARRRNAARRGSLRAVSAFLKDVRLYNSQLSGNCWKVRQILALRGLDYERIEVDVFDRSNRGEVLGGKNPALRVPTLELDDGRHLAESNAILWYFGDGSEYVPDDPLERARVLQWMFFEQYEFEPSIAVARFWITLLGERDKYAAELESKWRGGNRALAALDGHLAGRDWLVGDGFTIADISLYAYTHVAEEGDFDLGQYPRVRSWIERVEAVPGYIPLEA